MQMSVITTKRNRPEEILKDPLAGCWGVVRGDYRSPNGAARSDACHNEARYKVTNLNYRPDRDPFNVGATVAYCGVHARHFRKLPYLYRVETL